MENSRCNCCGNSQGNWGWGQNQDKCKAHDNYKKDSHKYCCCCWEEKDNAYCEKENDFSKCGCSHYNSENKGYDCGCNSQKQGYGNYGFGNAGKNGYYGW